MQVYMSARVTKSAANVVMDTCPNREARSTPKKLKIKRKDSAMPLNVHSTTDNSEISWVAVTFENILASHSRDRRWHDVLQITRRKHGWIQRSLHTSRGPKLQNNTALCYCAPWSTEFQRTLVLLRAPFVQVGGSSSIFLTVSQERAGEALGSTR